MSATFNEVSTGCDLWRCQRPDGAGFAVAGHDRLLDRGGVRYEAAWCLGTAKISLSDRMFGSEFKLDGGLSSPSLTLADLESGRWDGATLQLLRGSWSEAAEGNLLCQGRLGATSIRRGVLTAAVDLLPTRLAEEPCVHTSPECRAVLGDRRCGVAMRGRKKRVTVVEVDGVEVRCSEALGSDFRFGRARWITGANAGLDMIIVDVEVDRLTFRDVPRCELEAGDVLLIFEGCDGQLATCSGRFGNAANFRGEPHLPGTDVLLRYPGA